MSFKSVRVRPLSKSAGMVALILFLLFIILLPRVLPFPAPFLTFDEITIGRWVSQMTRAALDGDWRNTANNYPAVTLMWLEAAQVKASEWLPGSTITPQALSDIDKQVFLTLPRRRLVLAIVNTIIIWVMFIWLRRLYNTFIAIAATILMALDPFLLTQSRVFRTEALTTGLMMLSAVSIILYAKEQRNRWIILSGILGAFATLTKITSLYLLPFTGLTLLAWPLLTGKRNLWDIVKSTTWGVLLWGFALSIIFFAAWPVLWVAPTAVFSEMYDIMLYSAQDASATWGAEGTFFFWGQVRQSDPGLWFYIWSLAYRTTPVLWLGIILAVVGWGLRLWSQYRDDGSKIEGETIQWVAPTLLIVAYMFFYFVAMSLGASKVDRYLLPLFPGLSILGAVGFGGLALWLGRRVAQTWLTNGAICSALLLTSAIIAWPHHPYYFSYWNPLLGGGQGAVQVLPVGSGEGLDLMIDYLNGLPQSDAVKLAGDLDVYYICRLVFTGQCAPETEFLTSDYFISYIFAQQRHTIKPSILQTAQSLAVPIHSFTKDGLNYATLYQMPRHFYPAEQWLAEHGRLLGYVLSQTEVGAGQTIDVKIVWENGDNQGWRLDDSEFFISLIDHTGQPSLTVPARLEPEFEPYLSQPKEILLHTASLVLPPDLPIGAYTIEIGLRLKATQEKTWQFDLPASNNHLSVTHQILAADTDTLPIDYHLEQPIAKTGVRLVGYDKLTAGQQPPRLDLYWKIDDVMTSQNYIIDLKAYDHQDQLVTAWRTWLAPPAYPLVNWQPNQVVKVPLPLTSDISLLEDDYQLALSIFPAVDAAQPLATLVVGTLTAGEDLRPPVGMQHRLQATAPAAYLDLLGYDLIGIQTAESGTLFINLYWLLRQTSQPLESEVQVLAADQAIMTQQFAPIPTPDGLTTWQSVSRYELSLNQPPESLRIRVRSIADEAWLWLQMPDGSLVDQVVIEDILSKIRPAGE